MKAKLISHLVTLIISMLTPELLKQFADMVLDFVEDFVKGTKSTIDDRFVLPLCNQIRSAFDIPDDDIGATAIGSINTGAKGRGMMMGNIKEKKVKGKNDDQESSWEADDLGGSDQS